VTRKKPNGMTDGRPQPKTRQGKLAKVNSTRAVEPRLSLPAGAPDLTALSGVTREWLVPRLVREFLREQRARVPSPSGKQTFKC
jgi:hypothetical protein